MAPQDEKKQGESQGGPGGTQAAEESPKVVVTLNPDTGLYGYGFDATFDVVSGMRYALTEERYEKYSKVKHGNSQVIVKADS